MLPTLLLLAAAALRVGPDEPTVRWQDKDVLPADIPAELGGNAQETAVGWAPFAAKQGYRMFLEREGRVLLLVPEKNRTPKRELELIDKTCALFDRIAPAPVLDPAAAPANAPRQEGEGAAGQGSGESTDEGWSYSYTWGTAEWERDGQTAVLIQARNEEDYGAALQLIAGQHEYLQPWLAAARKLAGCSLEEPLVAIWLLEGEGLEEWNPDNELVHRLATQLVLRRFNRQPAWLLQGLAWYVEHELQGSHYCFPWRSEFVFAAEHGSWESALKNTHKKTDQLAAEQVTALSRGTFQIEQAQNAWGAATFLARHHPTALPAILEDLRVLMAEKGVIHSEDGTWERIPDWSPPAADQLAILKQRVGPDVLEELLAFYQKGKSYKPSKGG
jgi:hypothetical protein